MGRSSLCLSVLPRLSRLVWLLTVRCIVRVLHRGLVARVGLHRGIGSGFYSVESSICFACVILSKEGVSLKS